MATTKIPWVRNPDGSQGKVWNPASGCKSGPGARPMDLDWARSLRDQCVEAGVPFFFKQAKIDGKMVHMPALDGQVWEQFPEVRS